MTGQVPHSASVVAVDLGGTGIKAARLDLNGHAQQVLRRATPVAAGPDAVVAAVAATAADLTRPGTVAVGMCAAGLLDCAAGTVRYAPNLGLREVALADAVRERVRVPVVLEHDVRAACLAEQRLGDGRGIQDLLVVVLGTGVAAGVVADGALLRGATGIAGEFGHIPVHADGEPCPCGQRGCVEAYASAGAILRRYRAAGGAACSAAEVAARLDSDTRAARVWEQGADALGRALVAATVLLDHRLIVLAGGLTGAGNRLLEPVRDSLRRGLVWRSAPTVRLSALGAGAGLLGAALHALDRIGLSGAADSWRGPDLGL